MRTYANTLSRYYTGYDGAYPIFKSIMDREIYGWDDFIALPFAYQVFGDNVKTLVETTKYHKSIQYFCSLSPYMQG